MGEPDLRVWIFRKRDGAPHVFPSPVRVAPKNTVVFRNLTGSRATVKLMTASVDRPIDIPPGGTSQPIVIPEAPPDFYEYAVLLDGRESARGGSAPGFIVDP